MAVTIRLRRMGAKKKAFYRVVVTESRASVRGRFIESIGLYDPQKGLEAATIDAGKALRWLERGAQPSETVRQIFSRAGIRRGKIASS